MLISLIASSISFRNRLNSVVSTWQRLLEMASDPYRPELYYMRGPGPKCRAKQLREQSRL
jgi:hypothetical protein